VKDLMLYLHPALAALVILLALYVAVLGWRSRLQSAAEGAGAIHASKGLLLLTMLSVTWVLGLLGVASAHLESVQPGGSGHFLFGTGILAGFLLSAVLMLKQRQRKWVRLLHAFGNSLLLLLLMYQILLGINRLYKFGMLPFVPQDQATRSLFAIKFGLNSPSISATALQRYQWKTPEEGKVFSGDWKLDKDSILQSATTDSFPLLAFQSPAFGNFEYSAEFMIEAGQEDRYAGLAFRIVDKHNYYVVRASASEQSVTFSRFNNGARQILQTFPIRVAFQQWQTLKVMAKDAEFKIFLNGQPVGEIRDLGWKTGRVGLGTKADSVTRFRNITAKAL
jgi:Domain of Unknown Function (DUF1080)/Protein of unknown function (DUF4079)